MPKKAKKKPQTEQFCQFMWEMRHKYHVKTTEISRITGISRDYCFKIFSGVKHTKEFDYIILFALAIGMSLEETAVALDLNGMNVFGVTYRDVILMNSINRGRSIRETNRELEEAGLPELRFCKEEL